MSVTKLLAEASMEMKQHPVYGLVASWQSLERQLKRLLAQAGGKLTRHISTTVTDHGVIVHVRVTITVDGDTIETDGAAYAPWPDSGSGSKAPTDPVRVAVTAASRQAIQFALLAGADPVETEEAVGAGHEEPPQDEPEPEPDYGPDTEDPVQKEEGGYAGPPPTKPTAKPSEPERTKAPEQGRTWRIDNEPSPEQTNALAKAMTALSPAARRQVMQDIKLLKGRADLGALDKDQVIRATSRLAVDQYRQVVEWWAALDPEERSTLHQAGGPPLFCDDEEWLGVLVERASA